MMPSGSILWLRRRGSWAAALGLEPAAVVAARAVTSGCEILQRRLPPRPQHPFPARRRRCRLGLSAGARRRCRSLVHDLHRRLRRRLPGRQYVAEDPPPRVLWSPPAPVLLLAYAGFTFSGETIKNNADLRHDPPVRPLTVWGPVYVRHRRSRRSPGVVRCLADPTGLPPPVRPSPAGPSRCSPAPSASPTTPRRRWCRGAI